MLKHSRWRYLKHRQAISAEIVKTEECEVNDRQIDSGDGMKSGKVRWAVCPDGPRENERMRLGSPDWQGMVRHAWR